MSRVSFQSLLNSPFNGAQYLTVEKSPVSIRPISLSLSSSVDLFVSISSAIVGTSKTKLWWSYDWSGSDHPIKPLSRPSTFHINVAKPWPKIFNCGIYPSIISSFSYLLNLFFAHPYTSEISSCVEFSHFCLVLVIILNRSSESWTQRS